MAGMNLGPAILSEQLNGQDIFRQIIENTHVAVICADEAGIIRMWNVGAEEIFGWTKQEALGISMDLIIPEKYRARHWEGYFRTMKTGVTRYERERLAVPALTRNGTIISIEFNIVLLKTPHGRIAGIAGLLTDVTARRQEDLALRRRLAALEATMRPGGVEA
jgi:PAS domain S-box-containing protein